MRKNQSEEMRDMECVMKLIEWLWLRFYNKSQLGNPSFLVPTAGAQAKEGESALRERDENGIRQECEAEPQAGWSFCAEKHD